MWGRSQAARNGVSGLVAGSRNKQSRIPSSIPLDDIFLDPLLDLRQREMAENTTRIDFVLDLDDTGHARQPAAGLHQELPQTRQRPVVELRRGLGIVFLP